MGRGDMFTREDFECRLFKYFDPLKLHYDPHGARVFLAGGGAQYEDEVIPMEAWARPLWGLAPFWAGGGRSSDGFFESVYSVGLAAGTDPGHPEYWGTCRDHDQMFVEMAAIAYGLLLAPDVLWEPLSDLERGHVVTWLSQVNSHAFPPGNWLWFRVLVNLALREISGIYDGDTIQSDFDSLDSYYETNGWYKDGPSGIPDYYNAMTFQFFSLLYVWRFGALDAVRTERFTRRLRLFAADYVRLFAARGEGVPYGRSMTYRFAQAGFWSMTAAAGIDLGDEFAPGVLKGLVARNVDAWNGRAICDNGGVLSVGYKYPNLHMAEGYNAAGSPLWCLMAFACLALPADDAFWTAGALPLPVSTRGVHVALAQSALVQRDAMGEVVLYPSGRVPGHPFAQSDNKYSKFAYSSRFGFCVARSQRTLEEAAPDSMLVFVIDGRVYVRDGVKQSELVEGAVVSRWSPCRGIEVESRIEPSENGHVRTHIVTSEITCEAYDCGFAVPGDYHRVGLDEALRVCRVESAGTHPGCGILIKNEANTNISCGKTVIPAVRYQIEKGTTKLVTRIEAIDGWSF